VIDNFLESTSIHLHHETFHLFCFENSSNSSNKDLYSGLSFNLSLNEIISHTLTVIDGTSTLTQLTVK
jgi:hypothetical protein